MEYSMAMPFVDQDPRFALGFEAGQIWSRMERLEPFDGYLFHTQNREQVEMMCRRFLYSCDVLVLDDCWSRLSATPTEKLN